MGRVLSFLTGAFLGGLIGSTIGLLLAPASGVELRLQIQERAQDVQDEVKQAAANRRAELEQQLSVMRKPRHTPGM
jgi:gas vesicle protein